MVMLNNREAEAERVVGISPIEHERAIKKVKDEYSQLLEDANRKQVSTANRLSMLQGDYEELFTKYKKLEILLNQYKEKYGGEKIEEKSEEKVNLRSVVIEQEKVSSESIDELQNKINYLEHNFNEATLKVQELEKQESDIKKLQLKAAAELVVCNSKLKDTENIVSQRETELNAANKNIELLNKKIKEFEISSSGQNTKFKQEMNTVSTGSKEYIERLIKEKEILQEKIYEFEKKMIELTNQLQKSTNEISQFETEKNQLKMELDKLSNEKNESQNRIIILNERILLLENQLKLSQDQNNQFLENSKKELELLMAKNDQNKSSNEQSEQQKLLYEKELAIVKQQLTITENQLKESNEKFEKDKNDLLKNISLLNNEIEQFKNLIEIMKKEKIEDNHKIEKALEDNLKLQNESFERYKLATELENKNNDLNMQLAELKEQLLFAKRSLEELEEKGQSNLTSSLQQKQSQIDQLNREIHKIRDELNATKEKYEKLKTKQEDSKFNIFHSFALSLKCALLSSGKYIDIDIESMFEEVKDRDISEWNEYLTNFVEEASGSDY
eukprot:TRINITY_DN1504_c1_g1_i8.p1 TRINITY_DN1504_c1_g1~~TRINITY_DN1504_c1_g1_i8.p1  ORF type:complete len:559 (+),score=214.71 TRINITY_DN1504_c1_g1_i8:1042-2718(+)